MGVVYVIRMKGVNGVDLVFNYGYIYIILLFTFTGRRRQNMDQAKSIAAQYTSKEVLDALVDLLGYEEAEWIYSDSEGDVYAIVLRLEQKERDELYKFLTK